MRELSVSPPAAAVPRQRTPSPTRSPTRAASPPAMSGRAAAAAAAGRATAQASLGHAVQLSQEHKPRSTSPIRRLEEEQNARSMSPPRASSPIQRKLESMQEELRVARMSAQAALNSRYLHAERQEESRRSSPPRSPSPSQAGSFHSRLEKELQLRRERLTGDGVATAAAEAWMSEAAVPARQRSPAASPYQAAPSRTTPASSPYQTPEGRAEELKALRARMAQATDHMQRSGIPVSQPYREGAARSRSRSPSPNSRLGSSRGRAEGLEEHKQRIAEAQRRIRNWSREREAFT